MTAGSCCFPGSMTEVPRSVRESAATSYLPSKPEPATGLRVFVIPSCLLKPSTCPKPIGVWVEHALSDRARRSALARLGRDIKRGACEVARAEREALIAAERTGVRGGGNPRKVCAVHTTHVSQGETANTVPPNVSRQTSGEEVPWPWSRYYGRSLVRRMDTDKGYDPQSCRSSELLVISSCWADGAVTRKGSHRRAPE
eukprot:6206056-Pleurochrysis_carterae.AAC.7